MSTTARAVPNVVTGTSCMAVVVAPARLRPIRATIVPITAGGMSAWIHPVPARCTIAPITVSSRPVTRMPPSAAPVPPIAAAAVRGAMNANELPRYEGRRLPVMTRKSRVPRPEKSSAVVAGMPVRAGTSTVAPNMAITCCTPMPTVRGQLSRSSGATTVPGVMVRPSPWRRQPGPREGRVGVGDMAACRGVGDGGVGRFSGAWKPAHSPGSAPVIRVPWGAWLSTVV